jgi:hypothetical protein
MKFEDFLKEYFVSPGRLWEAISLMSDWKSSGRSEAKSNLSSFDLPKRNRKIHGRPGPAFLSISFAMFLEISKKCWTTSGSN